MELCDVRQLKPLLERHGFHFSKAKGQNFLIAPWVPERIAEQSGADAGCGVLEIGPGVGALTQQLCLRAGRVVAVELDTALRPLLRETVGGFDNLELVFGNALKLDLRKLAERSFAGLTPLACANLPYYITTPVLTALLEADCFACVTVMVQKEVAQRICASPGTPEYGAFSVFCQYHTEPRILFDVPPSCFLPQPKVTSSVLTLTRRAAPVCEIADEAVFFRTVRASFAMRRKTLVNGLAAGFPALGKARLTELLKSFGLPEAVRGETLDIPGFARIANEIAGIQATGDRQ